VDIFFGKYLMKFLWACRPKLHNEINHNKPHNYTCINLHIKFTHGLLSRKNNSKYLQLYFLKIYLVNGQFCCIHYIHRLYAHVSSSYNNKLYKIPNKKDNQRPFVQSQNSYLYSFLLDFGPSTIQIQITTFHIPML
jgi:hypothetical protein